MNKLKTYEGFFDFLKKSKKSINITHRDILDCLYDISDEPRITSELNGNVRGMFHELTDIVDNRNKIDGLRIIGDNIATFKLQYSPGKISDDEVSDILKNCQGYLSGLDCKMTFFIGRGKTEGRTWDQEFSDLNKMVNKTVNRNKYSKEVIRNITIKIKSKGLIDVF